MTGSLSPADFTAFFKAVWGVEPFPWQQRLVDLLVPSDDLPARAPEAARWPDVLDLPTGSGKTAVLDIAVFHLALEAHRGSARRAPVRIALIVDRRLIVDDAYARATRLAQALRDAIAKPEAANAVVLKVATALGALAGTGRPPLVVRRLRGGAPLEEDWAHTPVQPTILCSTVDQVGSRLLFRGYGISDRMKPIHAGLLGSDCLLLLDEAHLSEPFRQTLAAIRVLRAPDVAPFGFALLTATPGSTDGSTFSLRDDDRAHPVLAMRIKAAKPARLIEISARQGPDGEAARVEQIASTARAVLRDLTGQVAPHPAIGVVVNRVARARAVFESLQREDLADTLLLVGPARSVDRQELVPKLAPIRTGEHEARGALTRPLLVIATQTIEAGVDLDFDGLVTEAASLDALRQRFGRLNRGGRPITPVAAILAGKADIGAKADDVIYGDRIAKTWDVVRRLSGGTDIIDFGIEAFNRSVPSGEAQGLAAPYSNAPVLLPAYVELWSQTSPIPSVDPEVALFLHGPNTSSASVEIIWRADITEQDFQVDRARKPSRLLDCLKIMPPRVGESIQISLWAARRWLTLADLRQTELSDAVERAVQDNEPGDIGRPAFRWAGADSERTDIVHAKDLRSGDLIVVPCSYGGCDEWGWHPASDRMTRDVGDEAQWPYRSARYAVRVTPELIVQGFRQENSMARPSTSEDEMEGTSADLAEAIDRHGGDGPVRLLEAIRDLHLPQGMKNSLAAFSTRNGRLQAFYPYGIDRQGRPRGVVFRAIGGLQAADEQEPVGVAATETEEGSATAIGPVSLIVHSHDVQQWARWFTDLAGLESKVAADVVLASFLHDAGKADPRYQAYLMGGDPYGPDIGSVLAKSDGGLRANRDAWRTAGLPEGWRHEALSVRLAQLHPDFKSANDKELILWLIGTHHGFGRPLFPHGDLKDSEQRTNLLKAYGFDAILPAGHGPQSPAFEFQESDWSQLFVSLKRRYGVWGLARLESFVRLADHRASEIVVTPARTMTRKALHDRRQR